MGKVELQEQIRTIADDAKARGGCLLVQCLDGDLHLIEPASVELFTEYLTARDLDGTMVQIPYTMIAGVTVDPP